jgi:DNA-binding MarR family transcriptional regulator
MNTQRAPDTPDTAAPPAPADHYACAHAWSALTAAHTLVSERLSNALITACGLSINEFETLLRLEHATEGRRVCDLHDTVRLTQSALSRMVGRLVDRGLVQRHGDPRDKRSVQLVITPVGRDVLRQAIPVHAETIRTTLIDRLTTAELDVVADVLTRVAKELRTPGDNLTMKEQQ